ncbi:methionyl-tRNA formyltransferase [Patescibacteria group bacterium]|nr:methionyl-tRNA formyltransferase [Patescibacteria group bacterium]
MKIAIATIKPWNIKAAKNIKGHQVLLITKKEDLTTERLNKFKPDFVFFPHWSWRIPSSICKKYKCILFHMTDLPFGRGGSPLQNLVLRGHKKTKISAIQVEEGLDTGAIYLQKNLDISFGSAEQIYKRMAKIIFTKMIPEIIEKNPAPIPQKGKATTFTRRTPEQSDIQKAIMDTLDDFYDFVRILDAESYPRAFVQIGKFKIELSDIKKDKNSLHGKFTIIA